MTLYQSYIYEKTKQVNNNYCKLKDVTVMAYSLDFRMQQE